MSKKPLEPEEIAGILAVYDACNGDIHAHVPIPKIRNKFPKDLRPFTKTILEKVSRNPEGYIAKRKNRNVTYSITLNGIKLLQDLVIIPRKR